MDESWRMRMGVTEKPSLPRRKSTEETSRRTVFGDSETLDPNDFSDVFGGPPRSILCHQFSSDFSRSTLFYQEIFKPPDNAAPARMGRNLPEFRIPASKGEGFYDDIFGSDEDLRRSRSRSKSKTNSKSKSTSSSVLSSEDLSPLRPAVADDTTFSLFASRLSRLQNQDQGWNTIIMPLTVPCRWNSSTVMPEEHQRQTGMPAFFYNRPSYTENQFFDDEYIENCRSSQFGLSRQVPSPETISLEQNSYGSVKVSMDDLELNSPSSAVSSLCPDSDFKASKIQDKGLQEQEVELEDDEVMSSYVIEINSDHREGSEAAHGIDEAIAWAKEKFQRQNSEKNRSMRQHGKEESAEANGRPNAYGSSDGLMGLHGLMQPQVGKKHNEGATDGEKQESEKDQEQMEMEQLDENLRLWSAGKEANIRLLLSTLHHILWPNSGWYAISLTNLIESPHVKKAYQKAKLCLHPDKLQQRGATLPQKYIAERAFSILQDAWAAFVSQDVIFS